MKKTAYLLLLTLIALLPATAKQRENKVLVDMTVEEFKSFSELFEEDIFDFITSEACVKSRKVPGGPAPEVMKAHIEKVENFVKEFSADGGNLK